MGRLLTVLVLVVVLGLASSGLRGVFVAARLPKVQCVNLWSLRSVNLEDDEARTIFGTSRFAERTVAKVSGEILPSTVCRTGGLVLLLFLLFIGPTDILAR